MTLAILFNGQGAQYEGMGLDFDQAYSVSHDVFQLAEDVTGYPIREWIKDDIDALKETRYAQPAIAAVSLAIFAQLQQAHPQIAEAAYFAGLSLGEYASLIASGMLSLEEGFQLLKVRGDMMSTYCQELAQQAPVQMAAALGMPLEEVEALVAEIHTDQAPLYVANHNSTQQTIIAGVSEAIKTFRKRAKEAGYKKVIPLKVEGPFHSPLMQAVCEPFRETLDAFDFKQGHVPVISNTTLAVHQPDTIKSTLVEHMTHPVLWRETIDQLVEAGVTHVIQIGPGNTLVNLLKREANAPQSLVIDTVADLDQVADFLQDCQENKE